jgi:hypothetical protein
VESSVLLSLAVNPGVDFRVQNVERQRSISKHFIVEGAEVELVSELLVRLLAQFENHPIDDNLHPVETIRFVDALMKAIKISTC